MKHVTFLGTGGAFTIDNYHTNFVVWDDKTPDLMLLVDCGSDIRRSLSEAGITHRQIEAVYISHLHDDHCGGLEWLGFISFFDPDTNTPTLLSPDGIDIWEKLKPSMEWVDGRRNELSDYFFPCSSHNFMLRGDRFEAVPLVHISSDREREIMSYGLRFELNGTRIFWTSDVSMEHEKNLPAHYSWADIIFHDCEIGYDSHVHSTYERLCGLGSGVKKKMWLCHYQDGDLPDAVSDGFAGFVEKGRDFSF